MTAPAVISGDFATYKHVQGRKMLQLVIEVPAEMASAVFAALGTPGSGEGIPVALARLTAAPEPIAKPEAIKERQSFSDIPPSKQAGMLCREFSFQDFLVDQHSADRGQMDLLGPDCAAAMVRTICDVGSRAEMNVDGPAKTRWKSLEAEYYAWSRGMR